MHAPNRLMVRGNRGLSCFLLLLVKAAELNMVFTTESCSVCTPTSPKWPKIRLVTS
jgi:hypothetical protein